MTQQTILTRPQLQQRTRLEAMLEANTFSAYVYGYPHKTAYREITPAVSLRRAWADEDRDALHLYLHIPFCEMRCGFCNLFTAVTQDEHLFKAYIDTLERQCAVTAEALGDASFARLSIGGGTPTHLPTPLLERTLDLLEQHFHLDISAIPASIECSPETATFETLSLLRRRGVDRISMGVQSFLDNEAEQIHRRQERDTVHRALTFMNDLGFPTVNIDLMYGLPQQTAATWDQSIDQALSYNPAEIFLYPLYVRPLTRMGTSQNSWDDARMQLYRHGRARLLNAGYLPLSMRMFRRADAPQRDTPRYSNLVDGMLGLGCGARSYTSALHYSSAYAVGPGRVKQIIRDYVETKDDDFTQIRYGFALDLEEQKRRHIILALLSEERCAFGLDLNSYRGRFSREVMDDLPELQQLLNLGLASVTDDQQLRLTAAGVEAADVIGAWLFSPRVDALMHGYKAT